MNGVDVKSKNARESLSSQLNGKSHFISFPDDYEEFEEEDSNSGIENRVGKEKDGENEIIRTEANEEKTIEKNIVDCSINNGGCEQICAVEPDEASGLQQIVCACEDGYALDIDNKHCESEFRENESSEGDGRSVAAVIEQRCLGFSLAQRRFMFSAAMRDTLLLFRLIKSVCLL